MSPDSERAGATAPGASAPGASASGATAPGASASGATAPGTTASGGVRVRAAMREDVPQIHGFIVELAVYEREPDAVTGTPEMLGEALFGPRPSAEALVAEVDGEVLGFAVFHGTFSTWECLPGIWLEDLFVPERHRRHGAGHALLSHLAALAIDRGCARLEWHALDWNELALGFYERLGAERLSEWELHRLHGAALERVASGEARRRPV